MRKEITQETIQKVFKELQKRFYKKGEKKGMMGFTSIWEIYGKGEEERYEILQELHKKNKDSFIDESYDLIICYLFGIMSLQ